MWLCVTIFIMIPTRTFANYLYRDNSDTYLVYDMTIMTIVICKRFLAELTKICRVIVNSLNYLQL